MKFLCCALLLAASAIAAVPGDPAPPWQLKTLDGQSLSAAQFKGKVVVIDFWAPWCSPCVREIPGFVSLQKKYGGDGLVVIGVATDCDADSVQHFLDAHSLGYAVGMSNDQIYTAFGYPDALPTTFLIDRKGIIRDRRVGGESAAAYEKKVLACLHPSGG